jgi:hypothetical protein
MKFVIIEYKDGTIGAIICNEVMFDTVNGGWVTCAGISKRWGLVDPGTDVAQYPMWSVKGVWAT